MLTRAYPYLLVIIFVLAFLDAQFDIGVMEAAGLDIYFQAFTYEMTHYDPQQTHLNEPLTTYQTKVESFFVTKSGIKHEFLLNSLPFHFLLVPFLNDFERRMTEPPSVQQERYLCGALSRDLHEPLRMIAIDVSAHEHFHYELVCER